ncbi:MAG: hypothetical protein NW220_16890 [Leptolyngbyaceae cyanobacterium bins.349]|nr:hypothetical protein [Leptolyngbyaceae cyanobacterium bins.349]
MVLAVPRKKSEYKPGEHPHSLENLSKREPIYGEKKKRRELTVTDEGWEGAKQVAKEMGCSSLSDLIEKLGRRMIELQEK